MNTVSLTFRGEQHVLNAPSSWNELNAFQLKAWILATLSDMPESDRLKLAVPILWSIKPSLFKYIPEYYRVQLAPPLRFIFRENSLTRWLIRELKVRSTTYYGPADALSNITAHEFFSYCERQYWQYKSTKELSALNNLIAILYREKRKGVIDSDIRAELTDSGIGHRAKLLSKLPMHVKLAILVNYEGCRNYISGLHRLTFSGKGGKSKKRGDVTLSIAGGPLGDLKQTRSSNLYDFLLHLEELIEREEKLKQKTDGH